MAHRIDEIEGIAPTYSEKLYQAGIETTDDLLNVCSRREGRDELAGKTGINLDLLMRWCNVADLFRIRGIGRQFSELLGASGILTVEDLRRQNATNLSDKLHEVNARRKYSKITPSPHVVQRWIDQANNLELKLSH
jgi:predicted flap endonuclease-1-like 5' DNA nuclease